MSFFKNLTTLRSDDTFRIGDYYPTVVDDAVFSFVREFDGKKGYDSPTASIYIKKTAYILSKYNYILVVYYVIFLSFKVFGGHQFCQRGTVT